MGGIFAHLKNLPGAEKITKFKQARLIDYALEHGSIDNKTHGIMKDGACAAYTMLWLSEQLQQKSGQMKVRTKSFERSKGIKSENSKLSVETASMHAPMQALYMEFKSLKILYDSYELSPGEEKTTSGPFELVTSYCTYLKTGEAAFIAFDTAEKAASSTDEVGAHAVGIYKLSDAKIRFFDSNTGEYELVLESGEKGNTSKFFTAWVVACFYAFDNVSPSKAWGRTVTKRKFEMAIGADF